ncbi:MAG: hypothetical protein KDA44_16145 [Planctomycetales bacterium]|nr:hypothetical protein [Planctomycetales bacterium]
MSRLFATLLLVASLAALVTRAEMLHGSRSVARAQEWVRTADGWEPRDMVVVASGPAAPPTLHPGLVAGFLAMASTLVLVAFPGPPRD